MRIKAEIVSVPTRHTTVNGDYFKTVTFSAVIRPKTLIVPSGETFDVDDGTYALSGASVTERYGDGTILCAVDRIITANKVNDELSHIATESNSGWIVWIASLVTIATLLVLL